MSKKYLETIKALDGKLYHLEYHQLRLEKTLGMGTHVLEELVKPPLDGLYRCRVVYNEEDIDIEYIKYTKRQVQKLKLLYDDTIVYDKKYEDRDELNTLFSKREKADDILIIKNTLICDTSIANIAFFDGEKWLTPKTPLLEGVTRKRLLESGKLVLKDIRVKDIKRYKKVALMNAMVDFDIITQDNIEEIIC